MRPPPHRQRTDNATRWLAFAIGMLLIVIAASLQSTLGEFSLKAAIATYAIVAIGGFVLVAFLKRSRRPDPRDRYRP
jgi:amino acid transporter